MGTRLQLHQALCNLLGTDCVYFQPPPSHMMRYPCFRYELADIDLIHANNHNYRQMKAYTITFITEDPDTNMPETLLKFFPYAGFDRFYTADNLNHYVFHVYY